MNEIKQFFFKEHIINEHIFNEKNKEYSSYQSLRTGSYYGVFSYSK